MLYDVTDLDVYNRSLAALDKLYLLEKQIPTVRFKFRGQLTSAGESVPANIAEGFAKRKSAKEFIRFLNIAMGSSDEVITHSRSLKILGKHVRGINLELCNEVIEDYKVISKQLNKLQKNWIDYRRRSDLSD